MTESKVTPTSDIYEYDEKWADELKAIVNFALLETPKNPKVIGFDYIFNSPSSILSITQQAKVGFVEGLAADIAKLYVTPIDEFPNKYKVSYRSDESDTIDKVVEAHLGLLLNCGVIGALVITLLFGISLAPSDISETSLEFFGDEGCSVIWYIYYILVVAGFYISCLSVMQSISTYKQLSFWMSTQQTKLEYTQNVSIVGLIILSTTILPATIMLAVPAGSAIFISPQAGLISIILLFIAFLYVLHEVSLSEAKATVLLHLELKRILKIN